MPLHRRKKVNRKKEAKKMEADPPPVQNNIQPEVIAKPESLYEKLIDLWKVAKWKIVTFGCVVILILVVLLNYFGILVLSSSIPTLSFLPTKKQLIAEVNGEKIYAEEFEAAKGLFLSFRGKNADDPEIKKEALDFIINRRLLADEAKRRSIDVSEIVNNRFESGIKPPEVSDTTYRDYLFYEAIKEHLISSAIKWKLIDVFSIRYLYDDNAPPEEKKYKEVVDRKIQQYSEKIQDGLDIRQAIKERCEDQEINFLPYDPENKIYTTSFNGTVCREQHLDLRVGRDTNPLWGEKWLQQIFEGTKKGEVSPIIHFTDQNVGMYFIVYVSDEGGDAFSLESFINSLRDSSNVKIYQTI